MLVALRGTDDLDNLTGEPATALDDIAPAEAGRVELLGIALATKVYEGAQGPGGASVLEKGR